MVKINIKPVKQLDKQLRKSEKQFSKQLDTYFKDLEKSALRQANAIKSDNRKSIKLPDSKRIGLQNLNKNYFRQNDKISNDITKRQLLKEFRSTKDKDLIVGIKRDKQKAYNVRYANKLANKQFKDYKVKIDTAVKKALKDNPDLSVSEIKDIIREKSQAFRNSRVDLTAQTESIRISNDARKEIYNEMGNRIKGVIFIAVLDNRTSVTCQSRNGLVFAPGSSELAANTPPLHSNCRSHLDFIPAGSRKRLSQKRIISRVDKEVPAENVREVMKIR